MSFALSVRYAFGCNFLILGVDNQPVGVVFGWLVASAGCFAVFLVHMGDLLCADKGFPVRVFNFASLSDWGFWFMSTVVKMCEPYTYANLSFVAVGVRHVGNVSVWGSAVMGLGFVSWGSGEGVHVSYDVRATDPAKVSGDVGWVVGRVKMTVGVSGEVASSEVLMRRMVDEFKVVMRNRVARGQPLVVFEGGLLVFRQCVVFATV